jgi:hypothetical protein
MDFTVPQPFKTLWKNKELLSNVVTACLVGLGTVLLLTVFAQPDKPIPEKPANAVCPRAGKAKLTGTKPKPDIVASSKSTLTIYIGRAGGRQTRDSNPLAVQSGQVSFGAGDQLCTVNSDFVRSDGATLPAFQVTSNAVVSNNGRDITISLSVAPRYRVIGGYGRYTGSVSLNDSRAVGGSVPVTIDVYYPDVDLVALLGLLLSYAGLIWGLLVRLADRGVQTSGEGELFFANMALRVAVIATSIPIINAQAISNPSWTGSFSDFIKLGGVVAAAAIAATPSLRAIVSRMHKTTP